MSYHRARRISLVSFSASEAYSSFQAFLDESGYLASEIREARPWLERGPRPGTFLTILFVGAKGVCGGDIAKIAERSLQERLFCVFESACRRRDPVLLRACQDFLEFPCGREEIVRRLEMCGVLPQSVAPRTAEDHLLEEFARLHLVGESEAFRSFLRRLKTAARFAAPVLLEGETGSGKELAAHAIHYMSPRRDGPFIPLNCGAIPDALLENELFGHEKGAFTDAREAQEGLVALAGGGTLFLDEVDALSARGQVTLLRFLQNQEYKPLGGRHLRRSDVRLVSASNTPLQQCLENGRFRNDLLFRLNVLSFNLPPLRERAGDVILLAEHFAAKLASQYGGGVKRFSPLAIEWMRRYDWPGNVRELENFVHRGYVESEGAMIDLPAGCPPPTEIPHGASPPRRFQEAKAQAVAEFERRYLSGLMRECEGNVTQAARKAGKERRALGKLLKKHNIAASR